MSDWKTVLSRVPQGSVLEPLLFVIYIIKSKINVTKLFADDTKIIATIKNDLDLKILQDDIDQLVEWDNQWQRASMENSNLLFE